jgi:hypothetical protein
MSAPDLHLRVVELNAPTATDELIAALEESLEEVKAGRFETIFFIGFCPDGGWVTRQLGVTRKALEVLGALECLKFDVMRAAEVDE